MRMCKGGLHIISPAGSQMLARRPLRAINNCPATSTWLPCHSDHAQRVEIRSFRSDFRQLCRVVDMNEAGRGGGGEEDEGRRRNEEGNEGGREIGTFL